MTYLYLITDGEFHKIGISRDPEQRAKTIRGANPRNVRVLWAATGSREIERMMHVAYEPFQKWGEWFDLRAFDTNEAIILDVIAEYHDAVRRVNRWR